jgi:hypothetical protein
VGKTSAALLAASLSLFTSAAWSADAAPPPPATNAASLHWQHKLSEVVVTNTGAEGKTTGTLDLPVLDYFLQAIAGLTEQYPPHFDNAAERADVTDKVTRLTTLLSELDEGSTVDINILRREAFAYALAYKLDLPGSGDKANELYQRLLKQTPDDPAANFLYGEFLAGTAKLQSQGIPYLRKALKLGIKQANYTLGLVYVSGGDTKQGLACLQQYSADFPADQRVKAVIAAVKSGDIPREQHP